MTTGERLAQISGLSGVSAAAMLLAVGVGATTGAALVNYSQLPTGTAEEHLLVDRVAVQQDTNVGGGLFKPLKAAAPHSVSARATSSWAVVFPQPVVRVSVPASPQFTRTKIAVHWAQPLAPYSGLSTPPIARSSKTGNFSKKPFAGAGSVFVHGRSFVGGELLYPTGGAVAPACGSASFSYGLVLPPDTVKNLTPEMMMFL